MRGKGYKAGPDRWPVGRLNGSTRCHAVAGTTARCAL